MFNFGFDPEQFASLGSSFDVGDPFSPTPVAPVAVVKPSPTPVTQYRYQGGGIPSFMGINLEAIRAAQAAPKPVVVPAPKKLPSAPKIVKAPVASVTPKQERVIAKGPAFVAPSAPVVQPTPVVSRSSNTFSGLPSNEDISFSSGDVYETPDKALGGFASFIGNLESQRRDTNNKYGLTQFDPSDYMRAGLSGPRDLGNTAARDALTSYVKDNNMPLTQVRDGVTYHLTGGSETFNDMLHGRVRDGIWQDQGPVGTYSTVYIDTSQSMFQEVLNNPAIRIGAAIATGGTSEAVISAGKGLTGETLHAGDWLSMATIGLKETGMLKAPASAEEARKIGELAAQSGNVASGMVAEQLALSGVGLGPLTYSQSTALLNATATGDPKSFIYSTVGNAAIDKVFAEATDTVEGMSNTGRVAGIFQSDDLKAGLLKVVDKVSSGEDFDKALIYGLGTYIKEGGGLNIPTPDGLGFDLPSVDLGILEDVAKKVGDELSDLDTAVRKGLREVDRTIQPVTKKIGKVLSEADTLARQGLSAFDDAVIQPTGEFLSAADTAARKALTQLDEGLYDIQSPFSTPEIDLPSIDLPNFNLPSLGMGMGMLLSGAPAPTATTGKIFENELFKFKNKIELTEFGPLNQPEQEVDIEDFLTSPFESAFTTSQRFA